MIRNIYARLAIMRFFFLMIPLSLLGLSACQSSPATKANDIDSDVCIGEPVVLDDPDSPVDLEAMAKQADCF